MLSADQVPVKTAHSKMRWHEWVVRIAGSTGLLIRSPRRRALPAERHGDAERLRGLEIDDQLEFCDLLDRQVGRLLAFENPPGVDAKQAVIIRFTGSKLSRPPAAANAR